MKKHVLICGLGILLGFLLNTGVLAAANSSIGRWTKVMGYVAGRRTLHCNGRTLS